jgi:hypothetical protein
VDIVKERLGGYCERKVEWILRKEGWVDIVKGRLGGYCERKVRRILRKKG